VTMEFYESLSTYNTKIVFLRQTLSLSPEQYTLAFI
jgi:hypothetical protein